MSYDLTKLTKLGHLKTLAEKTKEVTDTLQADITTLESNLTTLDGSAIKGVKVNGSALAVSDNYVNVPVPTDDEIKAIADTSAQSAVAESGHAHYEKVDSLPDAKDAEANVIYLVMNEETNHYDMYVLISGAMELIDDTTVDLTPYATKEDLEKAIANAEYAHPSYTSYENGFYKVTVDSTGHVSNATAVTKDDITALGIPAQDTTYDLSSYVTTSDIASDSEVTEMLNNVYGE